jgi:hypothetical protein
VRIYNKPTGRPPGRGQRLVRDSLIDWLTVYLSEGPVPLKAIRKAVRGRGDSWATLRLCKKEIGVTSTVSGGEWYWSLSGALNLPAAVRADETEPQPALEPIAPPPDWAAIDEHASKRDQEEKSRRKPKYWTQADPAAYMATLTYPEGWSQYQEMRGLKPPLPNEAAMIEVWRERSKLP